MSVSRRRFLQSTAAASVLMMPAVKGAVSNSSQIKRTDYSRFSQRAIKVMQLASQQAQQLSHDYVGTEHLLLALFLESESHAADNWLQEVGATYEDVFGVVETVVGRGQPYVLMGKLPQSDNLKSCIADTAQLFGDSHDRRIDPEYMMLAIIESFGTRANLILQEMWIERGSVRIAIEEAIS